MTILSVTDAAPVEHVLMSAIAVKVAQTVQLSVRDVTKPAQTVKMQHCVLNVVFVALTAWMVNGVITVIPVLHVL